MPSQFYGFIWATKTLLYIHFTKQWALTVYESLISCFIALIYLTLVRFTLKWNLWLYDVDVIFYIQSANGMSNIIIVLIYGTIKVGIIASSLISAYKVKELIFYHLAMLLVSTIFWHQCVVWPQAFEQMVEEVLLNQKAHCQ